MARSYDFDQAVSPRAGYHTPDDSLFAFSAGDREEAAGAAGPQPGGEERAEAQGEGREGEEEAEEGEGLLVSCGSSFCVLPAEKHCSHACAGSQIMFAAASSQLAAGFEAWRSDVSFCLLPRLQVYSRTPDNGDSSGELEAAAAADRAGPAVEFEQEEERREEDEEGEGDEAEEAEDPVEPAERHAAAVATAAARWGGAGGRESHCCSGVPPGYNPMASVEVCALLHLLGSRMPATLHGPSASAASTSWW